MRITRASARGMLSIAPLEVVHGLRRDLKAALNGIPIGWRVFCAWTCARHTG